MAHIAKLGALTDELVTLLTSTSPKSDPARFNVYRESALRRLRYHNYPRTNQFDVASRLDGLEEKFRVYCEDPLADALKERVDKLLKKSSKWTPEVLHLLLELSDKPVSKAKLEDLEFLREPEPETGPPLKWRDIVAEDPLMREKSVWKNVDFGADSSDDGDEFEESRSETSDVTGSTVLSSVDEESSRRPENYVEAIGNKEDLDSLRKAQFWHRTTDLESRPGTHITELQAIREVLFMLLGLPTSLFEVSTNATPPTVTPSKNYSLKHASIEAFRKLSQTFVTQGSAILLLRSWIKRTQSIPLLQALQNFISERIIVLDTFLSKLEQRYIAITEDIVVSIIGLQTEISSCIRPLLRLAEIIACLDQEPYAHAFRYLEMLYDETCILQMAGDDELYRFMGELFFECFQIYLRPIRTWMEEGELGQGDKVFFISEASGDVQPALLWQSRYKLRRTQAGVLHAPKFLKTAANKIFTTGKSVVVLKHLNQFHSLKTSRSRYEPTLDFNTVCNPWSLSLAPFRELFEQAFDAWIQSKHHLASLTLRKTLFDSCGLYSSLEALTHVYFLSDGAASSFFASSIFDKLDTLDVSWNDRFTLNSLIQSTIGNNTSVSSSHLRTVIIPLPRKYQYISRCRRTVKTLSCIELKYFLPWPILLVLNQSSFPSYQRIFTFLLQIRRCSHILTRSRLISDRLLNAGSASERALYYAIRTRLLWFTQTLYHYLAIFVLSPNSETMFCNLREADDVDSMITVHSTYVKKMIDQTLLGSKLEPIHKSILTILDIGIKLEDAHAINVAAQTAAEEEQQDLMDLSYASLGLTPTKRARASKSKLAASTSRQREREEDSSSDDSEKEIDVDLSIMSVGNEVEVEIPYDEKLRNLKNEFDRGVKFVAGGLRGVARAGAAPDNAKAWDLLGEMLEEGIGSGSGNGIGIGGRGGF